MNRNDNDSSAVKPEGDAKECAPLKSARAPDYQTLSPSKKPLNAQESYSPISNHRPALVDVNLESPLHKPAHAMSSPASNQSHEDRPTRIPRRVIHCSDGVIEEYSSDEAEPSEPEKTETGAGLNPQDLSWVPWMVHYTWFAGSSFLGYCDVWGEKLAWFFGITSPKYYYEIEEFKRAEADEKKEREEAELHGWRTLDPMQTVPTITQEMRHN
eukprot:maker-scaffold430_size173499-snap-gene-0.42 protein:Tk06995 transcript:maker-scaffold430_size173499-snap-gene-0.42-mRNA-1 annotation:"protein fam177a1"